MVRVLATLGVALVVSSGPATAQVNIGTSFRSMDVPDVNTANGTFFVPPDTMGGVGPNYWVQYSNGGFTIFNKAGSSAASVIKESSFWQTKAGLPAAVASTAGGDPRVRYDPLSGRWFVSALTNQSTNNSILIAISDSSDPTKTWKGVQITNSTGLFADFPTLGMDQNGVYVGVNNFTNGGSFSRVDVYSIPKADLLAPTPTVANMTRFVGTSTGFATQGVNNFSPGQTASTPGGLVASLVLPPPSLTNAVQFTPVNSAGGPGATLGTTTSISIAARTAPPSSASQPNGANTGTSSTVIDADDSRTAGAAYQVGNLVYMTYGVTVNSLAGIRVTVLNVSGATPTLQVEATLGGSADPNFSYIYPSIAANANGDVVVGYTRVGFVGSGNSSNRWPSAAVSVGKFSGGTLTFGSSTELYAGERDYVSFQGTHQVNRWGDYSATSVDPADPGVFWTTQEYATTTGSGNGNSFTNWATRATEVIPTVTGERRWMTAAAGDVSVGSNWFNGSAPAATDHAIFSRWSASNYTVTVPVASPPISYDRLSVRQTGINSTGTISTLTFALATNASLALTNAQPESAATPSLAVSEFQGQSTVSFTGGIVTAQTVVVAGQAGGVGTLRVENGATLTAAGNVYLGGTASAAGGTGSLVVDGSSAAAAVNVTGTLKLWQNDSQATVSSATLTVGGLTHGTGSPTVTLTNSTASLVINGGGSSTFGGVITGAGTVTMAGTGTQTLTGANTYSGNTSITQGTLALSGTGSVANSPIVTVATGATLDGSAVTGGANHDGARFALASGQTLNGYGSIAGPLGVRPGSTLAPGSSGPGKLTVSGGLVFTGGTFQTAITGPTPGTGYGQVEVTSGSINLGTGVTTLSLPSPSGTFSPTSEIVIIHGSGSATYAGGTFTGLPNGAAVAALAGLGGQTSWYIQYGVAEGTGLAPGNDVLATPVPEPAGMVTVVLAGLAATWRRRRSLEWSTDRSA
jgi:autotransporter-associated beta strand protein